MLLRNFRTLLTRCILPQSFHRAPVAVTGLRCSNIPSRGMKGTSKQSKVVKSEEPSSANESDFSDGADSYSADLNESENQANGSDTDIEGLQRHFYSGSSYSAEDELLQLNEVQKKAGTGKSSAVVTAELKGSMIREKSAYSVDMTHLRPNQSFMEDAIAAAEKSGDMSPSEAAAMRLATSVECLSAKELHQLRVRNLMEKYQRMPGDTGSTEVQVAVITERIRKVRLHLEQHKKR